MYAYVHPGVTVGQQVDNNRQQSYCPATGGIDTPAGKVVPVVWFCLRDVKGWIKEGKGLL